MSGAAKDWARQQRLLKKQERHLLAYLSDRANERGECWPSQKTIADDLCWDIRTVGSWLDRLEAEGLIRRTLRYTWNSRVGRTCRASDLIILQMTGSAPVARGSPESFSGERNVIHRKVLHGSPESFSGERNVIHRKVLHGSPEKLSGIHTMNPSVEPFTPSLRSGGARERSSPESFSGEPEVERQLELPMHGDVKAVPGAKSGPRSRRRIALSPDWRPLDVAYGVRLGLATAEVEREAERFRNHHRALGSQRADWDAAFRSWLDKVPEFRRVAAGAPRAANEPRLIPSSPAEPAGPPEWLQLRDRLRRELGVDIFAAWVAQLEWGGVDGKELRLFAPTRFYAKWIRQHHLDALRRAAEAELGVDTIEVVTDYACKSA